jgi:CDP-glucose 4,6-dehydratase
MYWRGRSVLVTGHTGFKGGWLALWLTRLGARVHGYALAAPTEPSLFIEAGITEQIASHHEGDVRDAEHLRQVFSSTRPEIVFHLAAQPLVRRSYREPVATFETNVMGTAQVLETVRHTDCVRVVQVITSDKCYENHEWPWAYRETDPLGGRDPYSASKGAQELVAAAWRSAFLHTKRPELSLATCRAGNVIGGGDWAEDRIVPDCVRALMRGEPIEVRNPRAVRPWQHVLEPLGAYLLLAREQWEQPREFDQAWNFGPGTHRPVSVGELASRLCRAWGGGDWAPASKDSQPHEHQLLQLEITKAGTRLGWYPVLSTEEAIALTTAWYRDRHRQGAGFDAAAACLEQIAACETRDPNQARRLALLRS